MADNPDNAENNGDSVPLISSRNPSSAPTSAQSTQLTQHRWYCHSGLIILFILTVLVFLCSFMSLWALFAFLLTIVLLTEIYREFVYPLKPDTLPTSFLATQFSLGAIVVPIALALISIVLTIALAVLFLLSIAIIFGVFYALYPDAGKVLTDDLNNLDSSPVIQALHTTFHYAVPAFSTVSNIYTKYSNSSYPSPWSDQNDPKPDLFAQKLWDDMINAGAPPYALVTTIVFIVITAFSYLIVQGLLNVSAFEFAKWSLFVRYRALTTDPASLSRNLGVTGLVTIALTGTFGISYLGFLTDSLFLSISSRTFFSAIIFFVTQLLNIVIFLAAQLLVASTFADISVNQNNLSLPAAFRTSIFATFLLGLIALPQPSVVEGAPIFLFFTFTLLRAYGAYLLTRSATARLQKALSHQASPA